ncbi:MAG: MerR family transcriptional regulator [Alphaproteobacteria bacterium]|nr:MerR family transcriptional regulator [Alphaproteobacteria bacterium]
MVTQSASDRGKSASAFRTIGEVSLELDLPQHVLRFWESKFNRLRPMKRGGGRRYYRPEDIELLKRIKQLLYEDGYTIKGVQKLLREGSSGKTDGRPPAPKPAAKPTAPQPGTAAAAPAQTPPAARPAPGLDGKTKQALKDVLSELEALRDVLKDKG